MHEGSSSLNGHYITNHYDPESKTWGQYNNEKYVQLTNEEALKSNKQGVIYILKAKSEQADDSTQSPNDSSTNPTPPQEVYVGGTQSPNVSSQNPTSPHDVYEGGTHIF